MLWVVLLFPNGKFKISLSYLLKLRHYQTDSQILLLNNVAINPRFNQDMAGKAFRLLFEMTDIWNAISDHTQQRSKAHFYYKQIFHD